jgi:hypothetical protein
MNSFGNFEIKQEMKILSIPLYPLIEKYNENKETQTNKKKLTNKNEVKMETVLNKKVFFPNEHISIKTYTSSESLISITSFSIKLKMVFNQKLTISRY